MVPFDAPTDSISPAHQRPAFLAVRFWQANACGDGGTKRSAQIDACLLETCPEGEIVEAVLPLQLGWKTALGILLQPHNWAALFKLRDFNLRVSVRGVRDAAIIREQVDALGERLKAVVWEATASAGAILACDKPIFGFPHNIESLNPAGRQLLGEKSPLLALVDEFGLLRKCNVINFIAKEEAYLAQNLGLDCGYLPYYPPAEVSTKLAAIRQRRLSTPPGEAFLIVGSATNVPTANSLALLLTEIRNRNEIARFKFILCGSATARYARDCGQNVDVRGRVSDEELTRLLETCRAAIVFQKEGSGMLTRITEFLLSGVPVVANLHAVRSIEQHAGLMIAADLQGVIDLVAHASFPVVCEPVSPESIGLDLGKARLQGQIRKLVT